MTCSFPLSQPDERGGFGGNKKYCHDVQLFTTFWDNLGHYTALGDHSWQHSLRGSPTAGIFAAHSTEGSFMEIYLSVMYLSID